VQTKYVTSLCCGVSGLGLHLAIRSGRARPTPFFTRSVKKLVNNNEMSSPSIETCKLCHLCVFLPWMAKVKKAIARAGRAKE